MATKKKVIQGGVDVQTASGVSALVVDETTGAVTVGAANKQIKTGDVGQASNTGAIWSPNKFTLAASASQTITVGRNGGMLMVCNDRVTGTAILHTSYSTNTITTISNTNSLVIVGAPGSGASAVYLTISGTTLTVTASSNMPSNANVSVLWIGMDAFS